MTAPPIKAVVFDAYGTLLDVHGAMQRHAARLPPDWERVSTEWRQKQLEYSWISALTGPAHHRDFWRITRDALDFVAARHRIADAELLTTLMHEYRCLPPYKDSAATLRALRGRGFRTAILSNGAPGMLHDAVAAAGLASLLDAVISVEDVGVFKPHPSVYGLASTALALTTAQMGFVSSNAWDAQAAAAAGFHVFWCNRSAQPTEYGLAESAVMMSGLQDLPRLLG